MTAGKKRGILFYCESHHGIGHYVRILAVAAAFKQAGWDVTVIFGGRCLPPVCVPDELRIMCVDALPTDSLDRLRERARRVLAVLLERKPEWYVTEHFPFGRWRSLLFHETVLKALAPLRAAGSIRTAISVRDIIDWGKRPSELARTILEFSRQHYDVILAHTDPDFAPWQLPAECRELSGPPMIYTGFVREFAKPALTVRDSSLAWLIDEKARGANVLLISVGGGADSEADLDLIARAVRPLIQTGKWAALCVCGPRASPDCCRDLGRLYGGINGFKVVRLVPSLHDYFGICDVSISHCGYNTAVHLFTSLCGAVVLPSIRESAEQSRRAEILSRRQRVLLLRRTKSVCDAIPVALARALVTTKGRHLAVATDGAQRSVSALADLWADSKAVVECL